MYQAYGIFGRIRGWIDLPWIDRRQFGCVGPYGHSPDIEKEVDADIEALVSVCVCGIHDGHGL
jgi:hypothetical protein